MKIEEKWPRDFRGDVVQWCRRTTDGRRDDDERQVITIVHPEPSAQMSSKIELVLMIYKRNVAASLNQEFHVRPDKSGRK